MELLVMLAHVESLVGLQYFTNWLPDDELVWDKSEPLGWDGAQQTQIVRWV